MSNPNQSNKPQDFELDENGELIVKDPELAQALDELSPEDLDQVAGGGDNIKCTNVRCFQQQ